MVDKGTIIIIVLIVAVVAALGGYWWWTHRQQRKEEQAAPSYIASVASDVPVNIPPQSWLPQWACPQTWSIEVGTCGNADRTGQAAFVGGYQYRCVNDDKLLVEGNAAVDHDTQGCFTYTPVGSDDSADPLGGYAFTAESALTNPNNLNLKFDELKYVLQADRSGAGAQLYDAYASVSCPTNGLVLHNLGDPAHPMNGAYHNPQLKAADFLMRDTLPYQPPGVAGNARVLLVRDLGFTCPGDGSGPDACQWFDTTPNLTVSCQGTDAALPCADATIWNSCVTAAFERNDVAKPDFDSNAPHSVFPTARALVGSFGDDLMKDLQDCNVKGVGAWNSRHQPSDCSLRGVGADECAQQMPLQMRPRPIKVLSGTSWHMAHTLEHGFVIYPADLHTSGTGTILTRSMVSAATNGHELELVHADQLPHSATWTAYAQADSSPYFAALPAGTASSASPWLQLVQC